LQLKKGCLSKIARLAAIDFNIFFFLIGCYGLALGGDRNVFYAGWVRRIWTIFLFAIHSQKISIIFGIDADAGENSDYSAGYSIGSL
jgi:hypothetical protein